MMQSSMGGEAITDGRTPSAPRPGQFEIADSPQHEWHLGAGQGFVITMPGVYRLSVTPATHPDRGTVQRGGRQYHSSRWRAGESVSLVNLDTGAVVATFTARDPRGHHPVQVRWGSQPGQMTIAQKDGALIHDQRFPEDDGREATLRLAPGRYAFKPSDGFIGGFHAHVKARG
jgi:hypothetical protein